VSRIEVAWIIMRNYLRIFPLFLFISSIPLLGQSLERPQSIVIPISSIGEVSETRQQILQNTLTQELSKHFQILPQDQYERVQEKVFEELDYEECTEDQCIIRIQELIQIENVFNLQVIGEEGDTQLNLKWMNLDEKRNREDFCEDCKTMELRKRVKGLVEQLMEVTESKTIVLREKNKEVLFREMDRETWRREGSRWFRIGDEKTMIRFEGETINGIPNGYGIIILPDGDTFEGKFIDGDYINGRYRFVTGSVYDGSFKKGKIDGLGTHKFSNGDVYIGGFKNGLKDGKGKYIWNSGDQYDGEWINDIKDGMGRFLYADGRLRVGEWENGRPWNVKEYDENGKIIVEWDNGIKGIKKGKLSGIKNKFGQWIWSKYRVDNKEWEYEGEIVDGKPNGNGVLFILKHRYEGSFKNGLMDGQGKYTYPNGSIYEGNWEKGQRSGKGYFMSTNGDKYDGVWKLDIPWEVKCYDKNNNIFKKIDYENTTYYNIFIDGKYIWKTEGNKENDINYRGEMVNGLPNGTGILNHQNKRNYSGQIKEGEYHGYGTLIIFGNKYTGTWIEGNPWNIIQYDEQNVEVKRWFEGIEQ